MARVTSFTRRRFRRILGLRQAAIVLTTPRSVQDVVAGVDPASHPVRWLPSAGEHASAFELISGSPPARQPTSGAQASVPEDDPGVENKRDLENGIEGVCAGGRSQAHQDGEGRRSPRHRTAGERSNMRLLQAVESSSFSTARLAPL